MKRIGSFLLIFIFSFKLSAQEETIKRWESVPALDEVKSSIVYLVVNDKESPQAKSFFEVLKENWKLSKVGIINHSEMGKINAKAFFISTIASHIQLDPKTTLKYESTAGGNLDVHLGITICVNKNPAKEGKSDLEHGPVYNVYQNKARLHEQAKAYAAGQNFSVFEMPDSSFEAWGLGFFKRRLYEMQFYLKREGVNFRDEHYLVDLKFLAKDTLLVPDYVFSNYRLESDSYKNELETVFSKYKYAYRIVKASEINSKLLNSKARFFYVLNETGTDISTNIKIYDSAQGMPVYNNTFMYGEGLSTSGIMRQIDSYIAKYKSK